MQPTNAAVIVDPYSSGRFLVYELKHRELPIICVRSSLKLGAFFLKAYETHKDYFVETVDYDNFESVQSLVDYLGTLPYKITAVFGGCEPGVELADHLSEALKLTTANGTKLLKARKDKAEMQEQLRQCGVPAAKQFRAGDLDQLLDWARKHNQWPVVAKPTGSSGSDGVFFCQSEEDLRAAHKDIIGKLNPNGVVNDEIALQEFLDGDEYIVDSVSYEGKHLCVAIWVYSKIKGLPWNATAIMNQQNKLLPPSGEKQDQLVDYVFRVLDAVGIRYGACHTEVMITKRGPILVEVNNRMHGLQGPRLIELATGTSKATYLADVLAGNGELFRKHYVASPDRYLYPMHMHCIQLVLISPICGYLKCPIQDVLTNMQLSSVVEICPALQKGQYLRQTCDLNSPPGFVLLVHESLQQIESDTKRIRAAEERGDLYITSSEPLPDSPKVSPNSSPKLKFLPSPRMQSVEKLEQLLASSEELPGEEFPETEIQLTGFEDALRGA
jgi:biotin carboxylase